MEFSTSSYSHIQTGMWIVQWLYRLKNLPKWHWTEFEVSVVDIRLDVYRFVVKKQVPQNVSLFCFKFAMHIHLLNHAENLLLKTRFSKRVFYRKVDSLYLQVARSVILSSVIDIIWISHIFLNSYISTKFVMLTPSNFKGLFIWSQYTGMSWLSETCFIPSLYDLDTPACPGWREVSI